MRTSEYIGELQSSTYMHKVSVARVEVLIVGSLDQPDQRHLGACKKCRFRGPIPTESETLRVGPSNVCLTRPPAVPDALKPENC